MVPILVYGLPFVIGFALGYFLSFPVVAILALIAAVIGLFALWRTSDWEIGGLLGVIIAFPCFSFVIGLAIATTIVYGLQTDLSWALRPGV